MTAPVKPLLALLMMMGMGGTCYAQTQTPFQFPTSNYLTAITFGFGSPNPKYGNKLHTGEDISASSRGMSVQAAGDGRIMLARRWKSCPNWGYILVIEHVLEDNSRVTSIYGHLDPTTVAVGENQSVARGTFLGKTGVYSCWGEHLHFGIHLGPYGAQVGTYPSWLLGYLAPSAFPDDYVKPSDFIRSRLAQCSSAASCEDGNSCTDDSCDVATGRCVRSYNALPCDDRVSCTVADTCNKGVCIGVPDNALCEDGNVCTDNYCTATGCAPPQPNNAACQDGNACTTGDTCSAGQCLGGAPLNCDDGNPCTIDSCSPATGCVHAPNPSCATCPVGAFCDDFNRATLGPAWQICGDVAIVSNALQFQNSSGTPTNCPSVGQNFAHATLVAPGTTLRDGSVAFDLDNGGPSRANNAFQTGFGGFFVHINQDTFNDTTCRRRVELHGPGGVLVTRCDTIIDPGRYEFSVFGSTIRFRNVAGGTPIDLQASDPTPTAPGPLGIGVNEDTTRLDNLVLIPAPVMGFFDDFNRPDSNSVGNGWSEIELSSSDARIKGNRLNFPGVDAAVAYRPHQGGAGGNNITMTWVYRKDGQSPNLNEYDGVSSHFDGGRGIGGLFVVWLPRPNGEVSIGDSQIMGTANFSFAVDTDYNFQWDIYPNYSMNVWIWRTSDPKPASPLLVIPAFTPVSTQPYWAIGNRLGSYFDDFRVETPARSSSTLFGSRIDTPTATGPVFVTAGDLNGDAYPDLAVGYDNSNSISVLFGNGDGTFVAGSPLTTGTQPQVIAIGDLNGDTHPDLAVSNHISRTLSLFLGDGAGGFSSLGNLPTAPVGNGPRVVVIGDFNKDGKPDLAVPSDDVTNPGKVSVYLGLGGGQFGARTDFPTGSSCRGLATGDLNGDGNLDLVTANQDNAGMISVLLGNGIGGFSAPTNFPSGDISVFVSLGDLNMDGRLDAAVANSGSGNVSILLGTGTGSFGPATSFATGNGPQSVQIADVNQDGFLDLVVANSGSNTVTILAGDGAGGVAFSSTLLTLAGPRSVAVADFNKDGRPDLAVASSTANTVSVFLGR